VSNYLAIASVTATLQQMLSAALEEKLPGAEVTITRPEVVGAASTGAGINLYLFQVLPNAALRNHDLPSRSAAGEFIDRPQAAVNLNYLLTCYGKEERLEPERLLGIAVTLFHTYPILNREEIAQAVNAIPGHLLAGSDLALQPEAVRITQQALTLEDLHKLWSIFSPVPYRLSTVFELAVVLLDADVHPARPLPVTRPLLTAGRLAHPVLEAIAPARLTYAPGAVFHAAGRNFSASTAVLIDGAVARARLVSPTSLEVALPEGVRAGVRQVGLASNVQLGMPPAAHAIPETGTLPLLLLPVAGRPRFVRDTDPREAHPRKKLALVRLLPQPPAGPGQRVELVLNRVGDSAGAVASPLSMTLPVVTRSGRPAADDLRHAFQAVGITLSPRLRLQQPRGSANFRLADESNGHVYFVRTDADPWMLYFCLAESDEPGTLAFAIPSLPKGDYLVRLRMDGVESQLTADPVTGEYSGPLVAIS